MKKDGNDVKENSINMQDIEDRVTDTVWSTDGTNSPKYEHGHQTALKQEWEHLQESPLETP